MILRICKNCKKEFRSYPSVVKNGYGIFCSKSCAQTGEFNVRFNGGLEKVFFNCLNCKKQFSILKREARYRIHKYCSRKCKDEYRKIAFSGENAPFWKGGIRKSHGYVNIYKPEHPFANVRGEVAEHQLVMEKKIGRYLREDEVAHHINHIKIDNRIENLLLLTKSKHGKLHGKMNKGKKNPSAIKNLIPYMKNKGWNIKRLEEIYG